MIDTKNNDLALKKHVKELMSLNIGLSIEIMGNLYLRELDNGSFAVGGTKNAFEKNIKEILSPESQWEEEIETMEEALKLFIVKRNEYKYGNDYWPFTDN